MIALPAMAQSTTTEPTNDQSTVLPREQSPLGPANPPFQSPRSEHHRNFTPSISPLSTTSRAQEEYPAEADHPRHPRSPEIKSTDTAMPNGDAATQDVAMRDDRDDRSSSLSDYEEGNLEDQENNDDLDNRLSPRRSPQPIEEADSEAETERLERTPQKPWKSTETGKTPSKLNQETTVDEDFSDSASSPRSPLRDPQSPSPTHRFKASPPVYAGEKRKRSTPISEPESPLSDPGSDYVAPMLSNGTTVAQQVAPGDSSEDAVDDADADAAIEAPNGEPSVPESAQQTPEPDEIDENPYISPMKAARLKGKKQRAKRQKETPVTQKPDYENDYDETMDIDEMQEDDDSAAKSEEDRESKKQAQASYTALAEKFHIFRTKLQAEKLAAAEEELEQLTRAQPDHPVYLAQLQTITQRCETKIRQEHALQYYKMQALANQTLAERAQLHSQFYQESRESRDRHLEHLGKTWYDIQKERRSQLQPDQAEKYLYKFPTKFSEQIRNQANYNREVSILSGIQKYVGFPAAPEINGTRPSELDDDLKAMKIPRQQTHSVQPPPVYQNHVDVNGMAARVAQERWVEQNPWANAQHPSHQQSRTPVPFPPYNLHNPTPSSNAAANLFPQASAQAHRTSSPFSTPLPPQKRADYPSNGLNSGETVGATSDPPSSAAQAQSINEKARKSRANDDGSPIDSLKVRGAISNPLVNREERRNFSNISSASTIDAPNDAAAGSDPDRHHHPYAAQIHGPMPPALPTSLSASQQAFPTSALHAQHGKADDRRPELYESVNFRPAIGAFGTPMPMFANGSPARQEKQRAT